MGRSSLPKPVETEVLRLSKRRCCLCFGLNADLDEKKGQIAHLDKNPSNNSLNNLAFLCLEHHDAYDSKTSQSKNFTMSEVKQYRTDLIAHFESDPDSVVESAGEGEADFRTAHAEPLQGYVHLPNEMSAALRRFLPNYDIPTASDLAADWSLYFDPDTFFPIGCSGQFVRDGVTDYAFFALHQQLKEYRIVVLIEEPDGTPRLIELESSEGSPTNRYVRCIRPGAHSVSTIIWKHEGPKTLHLQRDAIEVGTFESAACIYYWSDEAGEFVRQWISD